MEGSSGGAGIRSDGRRRKSYFVHVMETRVRVLGAEHPDTDQHGQPGVDVHESRPMEGG